MVKAIAQITKKRYVTNTTFRHENLINTIRQWIIEHIAEQTIDIQLNNVTTVNFIQGFFLRIVKPFHHVAACTKGRIEIERHQ